MQKLPDDLAVVVLQYLNPEKDCKPLEILMKYDEQKWYDFGGLHSCIFSGLKLFKGVDIVIDSAILALEPTIEHTKVVLKDLISVYAMFNGFDFKSGALLLGNFIDDFNAKGSLEAILIMFRS